MEPPLLTIWLPSIVPSRGFDVLSDVLEWLLVQRRLARWHIHSEVDYPPEVSAPQQFLTIRAALHNVRIWAPIRIWGLEHLLSEIRCEVKWAGLL